MRSEGWQAAIDGFIDAQAGDGLRPGTLRHRRYYISEFADQAPINPWATTVDDVRRFTEQPRWTQESGRTMRQALRAFFTWAHATAQHDEDLSPAREGAARVLPLAWCEAMRGYLTEGVSRGVSPGSIRLRRHRLCSLAQGLPDPWQVTTVDLRDYLGAHPEWRPETRKSVRSTIRSFYGWALEEGLIQADPSERLRPVRVPPGKPRPAQEEALVEALTNAEPRVHLMIALAAYAGLRACEIAKVNVADVDGDVLRVTGKGGSTREVPLVPGLHQALRDDAGEGGWAFPNRHTGKPMTAGSVTKLVGSELPPGATCHMLRHRFATVAFDGSRDLLTLSALLGHSRVETTQRYTRMPDDALRSVVAHVGDVIEHTGEAADGADMPAGWTWDPVDGFATLCPSSNPTLTQPCPPWCKIGHGHPYGPFAGETRTHARAAGEGVLIVATTEAVAADGPELVQEAGIMLTDDVPEVASAAQARALASRLLAAAVQLERLDLDPGSARP